MTAKEDTLKHQLNAGVEAVLEVLKQAEERIKVLEESKRELEAMQDRMRKHADAAKSRIKLNVGGKSFHTCKSTLLAVNSSYFSGMLGSGGWQPDDDGAYFIDRNPKMFGAVLDYLRTGELDIMGLPADKLKLLKNDFDYYCLTWPTKAHLVRWDKTVDSTRVTYDEAGLAATKTGGANNWDASTISETPTPAFKVLVRNRGAEGHVMVGFIEKSTFTAGGRNYNKARCLYLHDGKLYGAGKSSADYRNAAIQNNSVVECIHDRSTGTIRFKVDGADHGVAFDQVPDVELHAFCELPGANSSVLLQDI